MKMIIKHPNYHGLPIEKNNNGDYKWLAPKQHPIGKERVNWALKKAKELGIKNEPGFYAKVMFEIHPTKKNLSNLR